jgi:hypothetical protein
MKRRLTVLNVVLVAAVVFAGVQFRQRVKAARVRTLQAARSTPKTLPPLKYTPLVPEPPVMPSSYAAVAQQTLFDPSRNPNVPVDPLPLPPPPPPMPPLPAYHGMMSIGDGPMAFLSVGNGKNQATHLGEAIGPFKLLDVNSDEVIFEWDGKPVRQQLSRPSPDVSSPAGARTETAAAPAAPPAPELKGPGELIQDGRRTCNMNDGNAAGAVVDGMHKVIYKTPFGESCGWEK